MRIDHMGDRGGRGSVAEFLRGIGLARYTATFAEEEIDIDDEEEDADVEQMQVPAAVFGAAMGEGGGGGGTGALERFRRAKG